MKRTALFVMVLLLAAPALAGVYVDYDRTADLKSFKTFKWIDKPGTSMEYHNKLIHSRLKNYIEYLLSQGGMHEDTENPDLHVTYHVSSETEMSLDVSTYGYAWGPGFAWDPYWSGSWAHGGMVTAASTTVRSYDVGTLIIDIIRVEDNMLMWRGSATGIVVPENPEKLQKKIKKAVDKMIRKWEKMRPTD
jgi:hypothetical protein